ncbi:1-(5-phosphoribosyl)-5-[(5-phosphoribosylamino)methylideneamino]imidazole-4-carboxamide isomerase [Limisalsivibrio acetivorans]|uniref:1-(5-phosphoribosyl)-5-[(5- phosphoribosylamino)methylideneamino]imidazole-4- carboxamide isomerase n=1 Tax=Limisalsivibrio acetivorans TaxID=1304888 RepID=UPI0003B3A94E|nr:1-(5-phosphoribosyl)-5-[(5-phosphoribosylamino)methylideneamino]imidazole-4-carboxamide isomerase [Limisalsivibrio acetivorans]
MLIIPAIDLLGGRAVRLRQGDMDDYKVYFEDPAEAAKQFRDLGVKRLHIVDLDGAKKGDTVNFPVIERIVKEADMEVEVGGGIRNMDRMHAYFDIGVRYAILGTVVIKDPGFVKEAAKAFPGRIILGVDAKDGFVATEGWYEKSDITAAEVLEEYSGLDYESVIYTDISRDGMLTGINIEATSALADKSPNPVIASGGLKDITDIKALKKLNHPNIKGCIAGKAFYEGKIDLKEAMEL